MPAEDTRLKIIKHIHARGIFRTHSNICDGAFLKKQLTVFSCLLFSQKTLHCRCLTGFCIYINNYPTIFSIVAIQTQLKNGKQDISFFIHFHQEQSPMQVQVNMQSFRLISCAPHQSTADLLSLECFHPQSTGNGI